MNWDQFAGRWRQWVGQAKEKWGRLTDDDLTEVAGRRDQLAGMLQGRYGIAKEEAHAELDEFARELKLRT